MGEPPAKRVPLVLVTRPEPEATRTVDLLAARGVAALAGPLTRIAHRRGVAPPPAETEALVFTSANAVAAAAAQGWSLPPRPVYAVGPRTAEAARAVGHTRVVEGGGEATALLELLAEAPERRFCHLRGHHTARDLSVALAESGKALTPLTVYDAIAVPLAPAVAEALQAGRVTIVGLWSPRAARLCADTLTTHPPALRAGLAAVAISARAAAALETLGLHRIAVADAPTGEGMLRKIETVARG